MSEDVAMVTRTCQECGFPILAPKDAPCPYCAAEPHGAPDWLVERLQSALYGLPLTTLQRVKRALRSHGESADNAALEAALTSVHRPLAEWIRYQDGDAASVTPILSTIADVLLTLYVISEEPAPPRQLNDVIVNVLC
ncbi:MAG: hypothetical protein QOH82_216, partial [Mycobacterium sp.]|nr:hypothetical protein [Mycobacterium sp.]